MKKIHDTFWLKAIIFLLFVSADLFGQQFNSKGKEFWLGFMSNTESLFPAELTIYISSTTNTSGVVEIPLQRWSRSFTVNANSTVSINIPANLAMAVLSETVEKRAIHVTAKDLVTVYAFNYAPMTSDAAIILPVQTLGRDYYVQAYNYLTESLILIVPISNNTRIEIIPSETTQGGRQNGVPYTVTLNRGEVYQIKSEYYGDLSGTRIRVLSGDSIAVFGGADCTQVGHCGEKCNHLYDQMFPIRQTGQKEFITVPYRTRQGDVFRIIANNNSTYVTINGKPGINLDAGDSFDFQTAAPSLIESNFPISVAQYSRSRDCDGVMDSDPFYINLSSTDMLLDNITFNAFYTDIVLQYFVNIISPTSHVDSVYLDGIKIGNSFRQVPIKPEFSYAQVTVDAGDHILKSSGGIIAYVYAYGDREAYGYSAGVNIFGTFSMIDCPTTVNNSGDTIIYPLKISKAPFINTSGVHKYRTSLKFNPNVLRPVLDSTMEYNDDGILYIKSQIQDLETPATLKEVKFRAMLGDSACTTIFIDSLGWDEYNFEAKAKCEVCVKLCEADGQRLILSTDSLEFALIAPNPVTDVSEIDYILIENGHTELFITDVTGKKIEVLFNGPARQGNFNANIDASKYEYGVYYCVLRTPSAVYTQKVVVIK